MLDLLAGGPSVAIVGDHDRSKPSHVDVDRACARLRNGVTAAWVPTEEFVPDPTTRLVNVDGIWVAPSSPYRSFEGAIGAIRLARERGIPLFGTWGGFQHVLVEYARNVAGITGAAHAEMEPDAGRLVVAPLACSLVGESRVVRVVPGTRAASICGESPMVGYHNCSYGLAPEWIPALEAAGLVVSGYAQDAGAVIVELPGHSFYLATLFQPQAAPEDEPLNPLLAAFASAVVLHHAERKSARSRPEEGTLV